MEVNLNQNPELNQEEQKELQLPAEEEYRMMFSKGVHQYEKREFEEASKTFMEAHNKYPDQPETLVNYANCQYELLNTQEAIKYWKMAKEQDKYLINPYINLGNYYLANDNYQDAAIEFYNAFCINPHNEISLINLGITYEKMNNRKKAFLLYEFYLSGTLSVTSNNYKNIHKKIAMHKLNAIAQMKIGIYFEKKGYYRKALQSYYESLRVFPNFAKTYSNIGNIFYKLEKFDQAKLYWLEAYKIDKKQTQLCLNLGLCCEKLEDNVNAYAFYTAFIQRTMQNNQEVFLAQKAAEKLHSLLIASPEYVSRHKTQCEEYNKQEKFDDALVYYENLAILSNTSEITNQINNLKIKTNILYQAALTSFEMAQELYEKDKYEYALEKCKLSSSLWRNSYFEQNVFNLVSKCQTALGNSLNNMLKAKH